MAVGDLAVYSGAAAIEAADDAAVLAVLDGLSPNFAAISLGSQLLQAFCVRITNTAGTLQHNIVGMTGTNTASAYATKISGASTTLANTPTVGAGTGFTSGAGITGNNLVLNTADQDTATFIGWSAVEYYDGNVTAVIAFPQFTNRNVNGVTQDRLEIKFINPMTGANWDINTSNLPSGKTILVRFMGFLA